MLPGAAARVLSPDSMTFVSTLATVHHPLSRIEQRRHLGLRPRLGVDTDERLGTREPDQQPRAVVQEELHTVAGVECEHPLDPVRGEVSGLLTGEALHDLDLVARVR